MDNTETDMAELYKMMVNLYEQAPNITADSLINQFQNLAVNSTYTVDQMKALYDQVRNSSIGFSYQIDDMTQLKRYIVLGSETGTYYIEPQKLQDLNIKSIKRLIQKGRGKEVLDLIEEYSIKGRCPKDDPLLYVLAMCATFSVEDEDGLHINKELTIQQRKDMYLKLNQDAYKRVNKMCNIPTKLFLFNNICQGMVKKHREIHKLKELDRGACNVAGPSSSNPNKRKAEDIVIEEPSTPTKKSKRGKNKRPKVAVRRSAGWGRMRRKGISQFYIDPKKDANKLLFHLTKYKKRHTWSHKQVLGYAHPKIPKKDPQKQAKDLVFTFVTRSFERFQKVADSIEEPDEATEDVINNINVIQVVSELSPQDEGSEDRLIDLFRQYGTNEYADVGRPSSFRLSFEHIPNGFLRCRKLWEIMLEDMPMMNMIRNLGTMTGCKVFENSANVAIVTKKLSNVQLLANARIHPMKILIAMQTYEKGHGKGKESAELANRGKGKKKKDDMETNQNDSVENTGNTWEPHAEIMKALDKAFYDSFKQPELGETYKTGKKFMLALDVSGSMNYSGCVGCPNITPAMASCALALMTWHLEGDENCRIVAFTDILRDIKADRTFTKDMTVAEAVRTTAQMTFGSTDCAQPMVYALDRHIDDIDVFIVYTDSETHAGNIHPSAALNKYRQQTPMKNAKLIVMGMESNGFTIADPKDPGMLDVVGFDAAVPDVIKSFVTGELDPPKLPLPQSRV